MKKVSYLNFTQLWRSRAKKVWQYWASNLSLNLDAFWISSGLLGSVELRMDNIEPKSFFYKRVAVFQDMECKIASNGCLLEDISNKKSVTVRNGCSLNSPSKNCLNRLWIGERSIVPFNLLHLRILPFLECLATDLRGSACISACDNNKSIGDISHPGHWPGNFSHSGHFTTPSPPPP